jgi:cytochrome P450
MRSDPMTSTMLSTGLDLTSAEVVADPYPFFGAGLHFCLGAPLARMELVESLTHLLTTMPDLHLVGEPASRGTFVLRGYTAVRLGGTHG